MLSEWWTAGNKEGDYNWQFPFSSHSRTVRSHRWRNALSIALRTTNRSNQFDSWHLNWTSHAMEKSDAMTYVEMIYVSEHGWGTNERTTLAPTSSGQPPSNYSVRWMAVQTGQTVALIIICAISQKSESRSNPSCLTPSLWHQSNDWFLKNPNFSYLTSAASSGPIECETLPRFRCPHPSRYVWCNHSTPHNGNKDGHAPGLRVQV